MRWKITNQIILMALIAVALGEESFQKKGTMSCSDQEKRCWLVIAPGSFDQEKVALVDGKSKKPFYVPRLNKIFVLAAGVFDKEKNQIRVFSLMPTTPVHKDLLN